LISRLTAELVPTGTWGANLRSLLPPSGWNRLRRWSYGEARNVCDICGDSGLNQGRTHAVECHEVWEYDDVRKVQTLVGVQALCPLCHCTKHYGRSLRVGMARKVRDQLKKVNGWTEDYAKDYESMIFQIHGMRSAYRWTVDIESALARYLQAGIIKQRDYDEAMKKLKAGPYSEEQ